MKKIILSLFLFVFLAQVINAQRMDSSWYKPRTLMGKPMPSINGKTINGEIINQETFRNKVVAIAFANLVNIGSLQQIAYLNKLRSDIKDSSFILLSIMPNAVSDVIDFNSKVPNSSMGYQLRMTYHFPVMQYPVVATCDKRNSDNTLRIACDSVVKDFLIGGYPDLIFIDKKGIIRSVHVGVPAADDKSKWNEIIYEEVIILLAEGE